MIFFLHFLLVLPLAVVNAQCPVVPVIGCAICGEGQCVGNPGAAVETEAFPAPVPCGTIEQAALAGSLSPAICESLLGAIAPCECGAPGEPGPTPAAATNDPVAETSVPPTAPPTADPTGNPVAAPVTVPADQVVQECPVVPAIGCAICGGGQCVGNPGAVVETEAFPVPVPCGTIEQAALAGSLSPAICESLLGAIAPCECGAPGAAGTVPAAATNDPVAETSVPPTTPPTADPTGNPVAAPVTVPTDQVVQECPVVPVFGCAICGEGQCVGNPEAVVETEAFPAPVPCGTIEQAALAGSLSSAICESLLGAIAPCGCGAPGPTPATATMDPVTEPETLEPATSIPLTTPPVPEPSIAPVASVTPSTVLVPNDPIVKECPELAINGCAICGEGQCVGNSEGIVTSSSLSAPIPCGTLEQVAVAGQLSPAVCEDVLPLVAPCECRSSDSGSAPAAVPSTPVDSSPQCPEMTDPNGCPVCGDGLCIQAPDAIFSAPGFPEVPCSSLEAAALAGAFSPEQCENFRQHADACACGLPTTVEPTPSPVQPTLAPTPAPLFTDPPVLTEGPTPKPRQRCDELALFVGFAPNIQLRAVTQITDETSGQGRVTMEATLTGLGWIGIGWSQDARMVPGFAVIGNDEEVLKWDMVSYATDVSAIARMPEERQTLTDASFFQNETHSVLRFTKILQEEGELALDGRGRNLMMWAHGMDNLIGYHGRNQGPRLLFLEPCSGGEPISPAPTPIRTLTPSAAPSTLNPTASQTDCSQFQQSVALVEDKLSMDYVVFEEGGDAYLKARMTFQGQAWLSFAIGVQGSPLMVPGTAVVGIPEATGDVQFNPGKYDMIDRTLPGVRLLPEELQTLLDAEIFQDDTVTILNFTKKLVESDDELPIESDGTNTFMWAYGFDNQFIAHEARGVFDLRLRTCLPISGEFQDDGFSENPTPCLDCEAVSPAPTPIRTLTPSEPPSTLNPTASQTDCSQFQQSVALVEDKLSMDYVVFEEGGDAYLKARMTFQGQAWLSFAIGVQGSPLMVPGTAVVGIPEATGDVQFNPGKYDMIARSLPGVRLLPEELQTLLDAEIFQDDTVTILNFTKKLVESDDELPIESDGTNTFMWAYGFDNQFIAHEARGVFDLRLRTCLPISGEFQDDGFSENPTPCLDCEAVSPAPTPIRTLTPSEQPSTLNPTASQTDCSQFQQSVALVEDKLSMDYVVFEEGGDAYLKARMTFQGQAWLSFAIGVQGSPLMVPGTAVVGIPEATGDVQFNPGKYDMIARSLPGVRLLPEELQTLLDAEIFQDDTVTILNFTKKLVESDDELPIESDGTNTFMWAYGFDNQFIAHEARGVFDLRLRTCSSISGEFQDDGFKALDAGSTAQSLWIAHGVFAALAWGLVSPLAIGASILRKRLPPGPRWYQLHLYLNLLAIAMTLISFFLAVAAHQQGTPAGTNPNHFSGLVHRSLGLAIVILALLQVVGGVFRVGAPKKKEDGSFEPKSPKRWAWELGHKGLGVALLSMCWYQCAEGFRLYARNFASANLSAVFWVVTGLVSGVIIFLFFWDKWLHQALVDVDMYMMAKHNPHKAQKARVAKILDEEKKLEQPHHDEASEKESLESENEVYVDTRFSNVVAVKEDMDTHLFGA